MRMKEFQRLQRRVKKEGNSWHLGEFMADDVISAFKLGLKACSKKCSKTKASRRQNQSMPLKGSEKGTKDPIDK